MLQTSFQLSIGWDHLAWPKCDFSPKKSLSFTTRSKSLLLGGVENERWVTVGPLFELWNCKAELLLGHITYV